MQTPNGNEYSVVNGKIFAAVNPSTPWIEFKSVEEVDEAFRKLKENLSNCPKCLVILDKNGICNNKECNLYQKNVRTISKEEYSNFRILMTTTPEIAGKKIIEIKRILISSSSELGGLNKQSTRLKNAAEVALLGLEKQAIEIGANAIVGITMAANSSQGGSSALFGSSDAIIAIGTAVVIEE